MRYVLFVKNECPYCIKAKELLQSKKENFRIVSFEPDQENVLKEIKEAYEWSTVPMIFQVKGNKNIDFIGGYDSLVDHLK